MLSLKSFHQIRPFEWEIPATHRPDMRGAVRFFASRRMLEAALSDLSIEQAINAACLPGLVGEVLVMPDMHQGYGFPIGGVAATHFPDGVISPGAIGYDINCGVRLLASSIHLEDIETHLKDLVIALDHHCPSGVGSDGPIKLSETELDQVCRLGAKWAYKKGLATLEDIRRTEENGCLDGADPSKVSIRAKTRGKTQLGTLGAGNHFLELDLVDEIFDLQAAGLMGLFKDCLTLQIHCGSRGFGHQVCTDYVQEFQKVVKKYGIALPDRELVCAPINSVEGQDYLAAMRSAANFAFCNRQVLTHSARLAFEEVLAENIKDWHLHQVYDLAHNMGKLETHTIQGENMKVCVHRKGATRAFGPGHPAIPDEYRSIGQPVFVPGSMGTASWVLVGTQGSMERSLGSCCHGAGRVMSRSKAKQEFRGERLIETLRKQGIIVQAGSLPGLAEEAPQAYKDVDEVIEAVIGAGIARKVARLRPIAVVKG